MNIENLYKLFLKSKFVSTDSRKVVPGSMFFALKGDHFDGNKYASIALEKGASFAIVDNPDVVNSEKHILVKDSLKTLQQLASFHRDSLGIPIIAITGTNGKTTTKELTSAILSQKYQTTYTQGNLNNHIGVPLTLMAMDATTEIGVVEMGANHPGEIRALCEIAHPNFGLITNIGKAHLEGFGSIEGIKHTKSELYRFLEATNGKAFLNENNSILLQLIGKKLETINYATKTSGVNGTIFNSGTYLSVDAEIGDSTTQISTKLIGNYNLENVLAAICIGNYFNIPVSEIKVALESYIPGNNRSQLMEKGNNKIIMDAYNANPSSMETAINNILSIKHPNKILILGDMLELGADSLIEHQKVIDRLKDHSEIKIYLLGENFYQTKKHSNVISVLNMSDLISLLKVHPLQNSLCLIKGSRGMKLEEVLKVL